jgi:hypothetical protein
MAKHITYIRTRTNIYICMFYFISLTIMLSTIYLSAFSVSHHRLYPIYLSICHYLSLYLSLYLTILDFFIYKSIYYLTLYLYLHLTIQLRPLHFSIYFSTYLCISPSRGVTCTSQSVSLSTFFLCLSPSRDVPFISLPNLFVLYLFVYLSLRGVPRTLHFLCTYLCIISPLACLLIFLSIYQLFISVSHQTVVALHF